MFQLKKEHVLLLFDKSIYIALLVIGIYFINEGEVIHRYQVGRTDFYQYNQAMSQFPTIGMWVISPSANSIIGRDFNISLTNNKHPPTILTVGKNNIKGTELEVDFQCWRNRKSGRIAFRITPLNSSTLGGWWHVRYIFTNASQWSESKVVIQLRGENNENNTSSCNSANMNHKLDELRQMLIKFDGRLNEMDRQLKHV